MVHSTHPASMAGGRMADRHQTWGGMRWTRSPCQTATRERTAKACGPGALVAPLGQKPGGTVTQKPVSPGRARHRPLTPSRRECRCFGFICGDYTRVLISPCTRGCGCSETPGIPRALSLSRAIEIQPGRDRAAGMRSRVLRHCERSEAIQSGMCTLDCFVAEPVIGPRFARTRCLLAVTTS
jgi:hypothetical protein